ncbi:MAG: peptide-methionine (S)-S-oxide reductase MsrA [Desulfurivibrionaceae bacterium]|nr:peptide-methionine (S)-S-oxide reductase MsrA [Desulfurivibrionaceae bacterium]
MKNPLSGRSILLIAIMTLCTAASAAADAGYEKATFAGGCFWCMEKPFEELDGVISVTSGYTYGASDNPIYKNYGDSGHVEAVEIVFDPARISYRELLEVYWRQIDPTDAGGQFADRGHPYTTAIFYHDRPQREAAEKSKELLNKSGLFRKPLVTPILPANTFYTAEDYHQDYYRKNPLRYNFYRRGSGRDRFLDKIWQGNKFPAEEVPVELGQKLTPPADKAIHEDAMKGGGADFSTASTAR